MEWDKKKIELRSPLYWVKWPRWRQENPPGQYPGGLTLSSWWYERPSWRAEQCRNNRERNIITEISSSHLYSNLIIKGTLDRNAIFVHYGYSINIRISLLKIVLYRKTTFYFYIYRYTWIFFTNCSTAFLDIPMQCGLFCQNFQTGCLVVVVGDY